MCQVKQVIFALNWISYNTPNSVIAQVILPDRKEAEEDKHTEKKR